MANPVQAPGCLNLNLNLTRMDFLPTSLRDVRVDIVGVHQVGDNGLSALIRGGEATTPIA